MKWMLEDQVIGSGSKPVGPFDSKEEAERYASEHLSGHGGGWLAVPIPATPSE